MKDAATRDAAAFTMLFDLNLVCHAKIYIYTKFVLANETALAEISPFTSIFDTSE